jgi:cbb3-type cytochrome oxidase subunit 3
MQDSTDINTGLAGSLVMVVLTIAFVILIVSFYRRLKRASALSSEASALSLPLASQDDDQK